MSNEDRIIEAKSTYQSFGSEYSEKGFWDTLINYAKQIGKNGVRLALILYYVLQSPNTPAWAKTLVVAALGYLGFPIDAIPDLIPIVGFTDDVAVLGAAIGSVASYVTPAIENQADAKLKEWF